MSKAPALKTGKNLTIVNMLEDPEYKNKLAQALPRVGITPERFVRTAFLALQGSPSLMKCDPKTLFGAMIVSASLGLEPNTPLGHSYLIPFNISRKDENGQWVKVPSVQFIIGYKGMVDLLYRSGKIVSVRGDVVYDGDVFDYEYGSRQFLKHKPQGSREGRKPIFAYACVKMKDVDEPVFEVVPWDEILRVRNSSQGYQSAMRYKKDGKDPQTPWVQNIHEMAVKTMIRKLFKFLPVSIEMMRAGELDAYGEHGIGDYSSFADNPSKAFDSVDSGGFSAAQDDDGPVIDHEPEPEKPKQTAKKPAKQADTPPPQAELQNDGAPFDMEFGD